MFRVSSQLNEIIGRNKRIIRQSDSIASTPRLQYQASNRLLDASVLINMTTGVFIPLAFFFLFIASTITHSSSGSRHRKKNPSHVPFTSSSLRTQTSIHTHTPTHITFALPLIFPHHLINIVAVLRSP